MALAMIALNSSSVNSELALTRGRLLFMHAYLYFLCTCWRKRSILIVTLCKYHCWEHFLQRKLASIFTVKYLKYFGSYYHFFDNPILLTLTQYTRWLTRHNILHNCLLIEQTMYAQCWKKLHGFCKISKYIMPCVLEAMCTLLEDGKNM